MREVKKAIIPIAGFGTRFLPITKSIPKCMLPINGKPIIQYLVEEAVDAGIEEIIFVTTYNKRSVEDYFDRTFELEYLLESKLKKEILSEIREIAKMAKFFFVRQPYPMGDGFAVLQAESFVGDDPFVIIFEDEILMQNQGRGVLSELIELYKKTGVTSTSLFNVPKEDVSKYGIASGNFLKDRNNLIQITKFIEKPKFTESEINLAQCGRYVCNPDVMKFLRKIYKKNIGSTEMNTRKALDEMGNGNEIRTSEAISSMISDGVPIYGLIFGGKRYDTGDKFGYMKAVVDFGLSSEYGDDLKKYLKNIIK